VDGKLKSHRFPTLGILVKNFTVECFLRHQNQPGLGCYSYNCFVSLVGRRKFDYDQEIANLTTAKLVELLFYESKGCCDSFYNLKLIRFQIRSSRSKGKIRKTSVKYRAT